MNTPESPQVFQIRTLRDIYMLPTKEQMLTCFDEIRESMVFAREANDLVQGIMPESLTAEERALGWPESVEWTDDGKKNVSAHFGGPDGKPMFSITMHDDGESPADPGAGTPFFPQLSPASGDASGSPAVAKCVPVGDPPTLAGVYGSTDSGGVSGEEVAS